MSEAANVLNFKVDGGIILELTRKLYQGNFFTTLTREDVQNSHDAKASYISIKNEFNTEDCPRTKISVEDDGIGMTKDIIINAFLALGESGKKEQQDAVGGFGVAKAICLYGNTKGKSPYREKEVEWYVVTTAKEEEELKTYYFDSEMMGKEPLKELEAKEKTGTTIVIYRKESTWLADDEYFRIALENCNIKTKLYYNGVLMEQLKRARKKYSTDWCDVYYKKDALNHQKNYAIIRINGVYQFREYVSSRMTGTAIVEIRSEHRPTDEEYPLTPNREQIKDGHGYRKELDDILDNFKSTEINQEENEPFTFEVWDNPGYNSCSYNSSSFFDEEEINPRSVSRENEMVMQEINAKKEELELKEREAKSQEDKKHYLELLKYEKEREEAYKKRLEEAAQKEKQEKMTKKIEGYWGKIASSIKIKNEDELSFDVNKYEEIFTANLPSIAIKRDRKVKTNIDLFNEKNLKVLYCAKVFTDLIFKLADNRLYAYDYTIGWTISDDAKAEYVQKDGGTYILMNPAGLKISDIRYFTLVLGSRLVHEVLHRKYYYHDEVFIAELHAILEEAFFSNVRLFERIAKEIIKGNH